ncbi:MAG: RluA family pseudouridine synthase [Spirochaetota bacterium]
MKARGGARGGGRSAVSFLHEDRDIIVVDKPEGLATIAPAGGRGKNLLDLVTERIRRRNPKGRAAVVHRLDRDTSGVMVFATNARSKATLMNEWDARASDRRYLALVEGKMEGDGGILDSWIAEAGPSRMRVAREGERGALRARGSWKRVDEGGGFTLLEVGLETGRKHQIRVQLAALGHPVAGDLHYGARRDPGGRLMLHASLLVLVHPATNETLRFESPAPPAFRAALSTSR